LTNTDKIWLIFGQVLAKYMPILGRNLAKCWLGYWQGIGQVLASFVQVLPDFGTTFA